MPVRSKQISKPRQAKIDAERQRALAYVALLPAAKKFKQEQANARRRAREAEKSAAAEATPTWSADAKANLSNFGSMMRSAGMIRRRVRDSVKWFRDLLRGYPDEPETPAIPGFPKTREQLLAQTDRLRRPPPAIGSMYFFVYDPKHKKTLPYYDKFPLVFPIGRYKDGFLGVNLHYLDIRSRTILLAELYSFVNNNKMNDRTRLILSYQALKKTSKYFMPCVKRYLSSHVRSKFVKIRPIDWEKAVFLPVDDFEKAPAFTVWKDSRKKNGIWRWLILLIFAPNGNRMV